jgi:methionyl-tRNA synthetase
MLHPIIPGFTNQATDFLNEKDISWGSINKALLGTSINTFKPIIVRIEEEQISNLLGN